MRLLFAILPVFVLLVVSELWLHKKSLQGGEFSRKLVHISVGSFVAFWPYFLSWDQIRLLSVAFFVVALLSKKLNVFKAIHSVQRPTWGELFFAMAVGGVTFITHVQAIYAVAILQMSLADGFAAVMGTRFGAAHRYGVFGHTKSIIGSVSFAVIAAVLLAGFSVVHAYLNPFVIVLIALLASSIENVGVQGLDNLLVPMLVAFILERLM